MRGWKQIAWGLLLVLIDIRIIVIDLLPDMIGYLLISIGASKLITTDKWRTAVIVTSLALAAMALPGMVMPADGEAGRSPFGYVFILGMVDGIGHLVIVYGICCLAASRALEEDDKEWAGAADSRRKAFLFINGFALLYHTFTFNMDNDWRLASFVFILAAIAMELAIIIFMFRTAKR